MQLTMKAFAWRTRWTVRAVFESWRWWVRVTHRKKREMDEIGTRTSAVTFSLHLFVWLIFVCNRSRRIARAAGRVCAMV